MTCHVTKLKMFSNWFLEHDNEFTVVHAVTRSQSNRHLWDVVEEEIRIMAVQLTHLLQMREAIMSIWTKISEECFQNNVESTPRSIKAVLKAKGAPTLY